MKPILGAHMSIAGGFYKAVERAAVVGCNCVQIFTSTPGKWPAYSPPDQLYTKNNNQWRAKPITDEDVARFQNALAASGVGRPLSHSSYLINLAAPDQELWKKSIDAFIDEMRRAEALGVPYVVLHPGAFTSSDEDAGLRAVVRALDEVHCQTRDIATQCLLETTAGQGTCLGCSFEQLATILNGVQESDRLGVCVDTCHVFAAGYPLSCENDYAMTFSEFDRVIGLGRIKAFHLNDSKRELGSRVDRHEHIGHGQLGLKAFQLLLNDPRFRQVPMYLETPKGEHQGRPWDAINLETLRGLVTSP